MKVKIKRVDNTLPLPSYKTAGAAAFDCHVRQTIIAEPKKVAYVPLNICIKPPAGHYIMMAARSSLHKKGLMLANGVAIGDEDFCGNKDEYHAALYNFSDQSVTIEKGERIVQMILKPYEKVEWDEVGDLGEKNRGGFGTTGSK